MEHIANAAGQLADHVHEYPALIQSLQWRFSELVKDPSVRLFTTRAADSLWEAYLGSLPYDKQYHTCYCCRRFIETYGGLVKITDSGEARSVVWNTEDAGPFYRSTIALLQRLVEHSKVTGVFVSDEQVWGTPVTGPWEHFAVTPPQHLVHTRRDKRPNEVAAEKLQDYGQAQAALNDYDQGTLVTAVRLLETDALYRSEKCLGVAKWLLERRRERTEAKPYSSNLLWRAIASAPPGYAHPRSSMIGTLLDDIAAGKSFEACAASFKAKMHPLRYQRPQAAPTPGAIQSAEKLVAQLGIERSLERRYARLDELETVWRPSAPDVPATPAGVFSHLAPKGAAPSKPMEIPPQTMTWSVFSDKILGDALEIDLLVPPHGNFVAMVTAQHADAPLIFQWDNPVSWYSYHGGSNAHEWGLSPGTWVRVTGLIDNPAHWSADRDHHAKGVMFVLENARDHRHDRIGNALFPESLRSELHAVRSVIEAYSKKAKIAGFEESSACGIVASRGQNKSFFSNLVLRVKKPTPASYIYDTVVNKYHIDRWE